ncbi:glycosyltransferase family 39 protein [Rhodopseudomonas palustris]|uniref:glycosyltransferase family 39 protein n=1 Tax=Rhodopseudomonas palustris TaxID=1076 RepID=UPI00115F48C0|nr:glycosyltransferase family 39 protein [Rhodopseudomonas palustris]QDL99719.1 glycosyltransferase family 39 protein [Rhodopseudomonas palustris]
MSAKSPPRRAFAPLTRWLDALLDPKRQELTVVWTLLAYMAIWTAYRIIATWPRDLHADETELYGWSRDLALGTDKHPPFSAWVARAWFTLVPPSDLSVHLLATANIALTLYIAWRTMRRYMDADKSLFGLALLTLIPFFNFIALKYNANAVLLPLWALTIHCFLRALEGRAALWAALAGVFAGASMLGKYWSIVLVVALGLAALIDPRRGRFFGSMAPWLMILCGGAVLAPHLWWLYAHDFPTLSYAEAHEAGSFADNLRDTLGYLAGCVGYAAVALIVAALLLRPSRAALADIAWPADPQRRTILIAQVLLIVAAVPVALVTGIRIVPLWAMPAYTLLPIVLLASPLIAVGRETVRRGLIVASAVSLGSLALSPAVALVIHLSDPPGPFEYASLLAEHVEREWRRNSDRPVPLVAGETVLAGNTAFYLRTDTKGFETADVAALKQRAEANGAVLVCPADNGGCIATAERIVAGQPQILRGKVWLSRPLFGQPGGRVSDVFFLVLPAGTSAK